MDNEMGVKRTTGKELGKDQSGRPKHSNMGFILEDDCADVVDEAGMQDNPTRTIPCVT